VARTAAAALAAGLVAAPASALDVRFEDRSAELVLTALERGALSADVAESIRRDDGYLLVFEHVAQSTTPPRRPEAVGAEFLAALDDVVAGGDDPRFRLREARAARDRYRDTLREFRRAERRARSQVEERLREMLPAGVDFSATAHLVVGGDAAGMAFSDRADIAIRLDDFVPAAGTQPALGSFAALLGHELFHVGFRVAGGLTPRPLGSDPGWDRLSETWGPFVVGEAWRASGEPWDAAAMENRLDAWDRPAGWAWRALDRYVAMLSRAQSEGTAVYAEAPLRDRDGREELVPWLDGIDADFAFLGRVTDRLNRGASADEIDALAAEGFRANGPLYRVGYRVADRIDRFTGRDALLRTIENGVLEFFDAYFETQPYGPGQMDSATEQEVRKIIREIRTVGRSRPAAG